MLTISAIISLLASVSAVPTGGKWTVSNTDHYGGSSPASHGSTGVYSESSTETCKHGEFRCKNENHLQQCGYLSAYPQSLGWLDHSSCSDDEKCSISSTFAGCFQELGLKNFFEI